VLLDTGIFIHSELPSSRSRTLCSALHNVSYILELARVSSLGWSHGHGVR
jgi:hypothetical protein